jgi:hypothetical protein
MRTTHLQNHVLQCLHFGLFSGRRLWLLPGFRCGDVSNLVSRLWTFCEIPIVGWFTPSFHRRQCKIPSRRINMWARLHTNLFICILKPKSTENRSSLGISQEVYSIACTARCLYNAYCCGLRYLHCCHLDNWRIAPVFTNICQYSHILGHVIL